MGRGQPGHLEDRVARRRAINDRYRAALGDVPGVTVHPTAPGSTYWLTQILVDPDLIPTGAGREAGRHALVGERIEARPVWKPMHLQPVFAPARARLTGTADRLFDRGLSLPSGSSLTDAEVDEIAALVTATNGGLTVRSVGCAPRSGA